MVVWWLVVGGRVVGWSGGRMVVWLCLNRRLERMECMECVLIYSWQPWMAKGGRLAHRPECVEYVEYAWSITIIWKNQVLKDKCEFMN